jgi:capsular exopolysaccharide synthesis family protein
VDIGTVEEFDSGPGLLTAVWKHGWIIVGISLAAGVLGFVVSLLQPVQYEATASLLLADPRNEGIFRDSAQVVIDPDRYVRNRAEFANSTAVLAEARDVAGADVSLERLRELVTVLPASELDLLTIRSRDGSPEGAAALADALGQAYQTVAQREVRNNAEAATTELKASIQELQADIDNVESQLQSAPRDPALQARRDAAVAELFDLQGRSRQVTVDAALYGAGVELFERAEPPHSPAQPKPLRNGLLAVVLGAIGATVWSWWRTRNEQSAGARQDAAPILRAPMLGVVPDFGEVGVTGNVPTITAPHSQAGEAYHFLVASLGFALERVGGSTILVTSASPSDGKTVTALNLAVAAVRDGRRTILVDADERVRGLTRLNCIATRSGLTDLADDTVAYNSCIGTVKVSDTVKLSFVPAGSPLQDPAGFFRTPGFRKALNRIKEQAELVIVDSPPLLAVADTSAIASQADGIVVVVTQGSPLRQLEEVRERLQFVGTPLLGYVFNRSEMRKDHYSYGGYGYGQPPRPVKGRGRWSATKRARSRAALRGDVRESASDGAPRRSA